MLSNVQAAALVSASASPAVPKPQSSDSTVANSLQHVANNAGSNQGANAEPRFVLGRDLVFGLTTEISQVRNYGCAHLGISRETVERADDGEPMLAVELFTGFSDMAEMGQARSGIPILDEFFTYYSNADSHYNVSRESRVPSSGDPNSDAHLKYNEQLRRMSKGALDSILAGGGTIHFLLDSQDMEVVLDKSAHHITSSELRWLYRNRDVLEERPGKVVFHNEGKIVDAPWNTHSDLWARYTPASSRLPTDSVDG
jgi:hypothetical protein